MPAKKSDSFFIRVTKDLGNTNTYHEKAISLGPFVDVLDKSVLRIHNIEVAFTDNTGRSNVISGVCAAQFQLLTQSQTDIVLPSNRAVVASGRVNCDAASGTGVLPTWTSNTLDVGPQHWTNGYLVATENLYLGGSASTNFDGDVYCTVIMECTVEKMDTQAGMALALSQQGAN
jgi:hypothetical protein